MFQGEGQKNRLFSNRLFLEAAASLNSCYESSVLVRMEDTRTDSEPPVSIVRGNRCLYCDRKASVFVNICYESYHLFVEKQLFVPAIWFAWPSLQLPRAEKGRGRDG